MTTIVCSSKMSVNFYQTVWYDIAEDSFHCSHYQEKLKSHKG